MSHAIGESDRLLTTLDNHTGGKYTTEQTLALIQCHATIALAQEVAGIRDLLGKIVVDGCPAFITDDPHAPISEVR